ncbi:apoptotic protease-activating factor 1-like [Tribolium madens]|uniref:apoptotic protease-activating factor 1-like n=1 Tax=Tribolium madens TaxID=41895 RepID=UPI001CF74D1A|nr:apoptotic protease-activating factor 1-like [Tribolium madens]
MAIFTNVVQEFREEIEANLTLDDVIDTLIAQKIIDEKLYIEIWGNQHNRVKYLLDIIIKDGKRCSTFIHILGTVARMKQISESIIASIEKIRKVIVTGGFPEFSLNYVVRNSVEWIKVANTIKDRALDLDPKLCGTLVVHGLPGFGKSCLVNQVLQTKRFLEVSGNAMFWINLGEYSDTSAIIHPLWNLYLTAVKLTDYVALSHRPDDIIILQNELKTLFLHENLANSYIILDDVKSSEVLNAFKLSCKTIVTTQDKNVANNSEAFFIKVTTGFTKKESIELLRKSLETDNLANRENLANRIHELCDGCPMLLNIIGSILKDSREEALSTDIIWKSLIDEIIRNDYLQHPTTMKVIHMIQRFVTCLDTEVQKCFHSLAVFPKHVNIRPEILMKLWDKTYYAVRQIMVELENKSLIVSFYNKDLKSYIYSIHSLVRTYLVEKANVDIKYYHEKLISQCDEIITKSPSDDPIANYIFGYYGYHAKNAELYNKFEKYFDLRFIENKIKRVGSADLLTDFEVYRDFITKKESRLERKLKDYIKFVHSYSAHLHISPETNIVQFAFFNDNNYVYEDAKNIASNNPDQLYFKLEPYSGGHKNFPVLKTKTVATATCFVDSKEVLVGTASGSIEVKSFRQYQHKVHRFEGHSDQIFSLQISPDSKSFLSISVDHSAKLWRFVEELDPQSPKLKQTNWKNLHSPDENAIPHKTFKIQDGDYITSAAFPYDTCDEIITASNKGKIMRWNVRTASIVRESSALGLPISRICYVHDSEQVIFAYDGKVYCYARGNLVYNGQFGILDDITDLVLIPIVSEYREVAVISGRKLEIWEYVKKIKRFSFETQSNITSTVINDEYLVLGTADYIYFYDYRCQKLHQYKNDYGKPTSLFILRESVAFICLDKESVQRCELYFEPCSKPLVRNLALFNCYWKESQPIYFIVNSENKIDIFYGHSTILAGIDEITDKIKCCSFSLCGNFLILGTESGKLYFYNYKKKKVNCLKICDDEIKFIKCFDVDHVDDDSVSVYGMVVVASSSKVVIIVDNRVKLELDIMDELTDLLYLRNRLLAFDVKGRFSIATVSDDQCLGWISTKYKDVIVATIHKGKNLLAIACNEGNGHILRVLTFISDNPLTLDCLFETKLNVTPTCMSLNSNGKFISVGGDSGDIEVFSIENKQKDLLLLHKKSVEQLVFAPNFESILVSLGDQIAWWNLSDFGKKSEKMNGNSDHSHQSLVFNFDPWQDKKLHDTVPYLLTSTNLHGKRLQYISASKDFRSFLIIDIDGNIFKMDIIDS